MENVRYGMGSAVSQVSKLRAKSALHQENADMSVDSVASRFNLGTAIVASVVALALTTGCSTKNYVRSQTAPLIQQTNELDTKTAQDHRNILDTDQRAQAGIAKAQDAAGTADQHAAVAGQSAEAAQQSAQQAVNRVDTLASVVANLDNYKQL